MAIDTALKRQAALGRSVLMLSQADGTIDKDDRAILLGLYLPYIAIIIARFFVLADVEIADTGYVDVEL